MVLHDRQAGGISVCRALPPTPAMWQRYLLPWDGSGLSVGEHGFGNVYVGTAFVSASMCVRVHVCVCVCVHEVVRVKDKDDVNTIKRLFFLMNA